MHDRIELNKIQALGVIGVLPEERDRAQPFEADIAIETDLSVAGVSDNLDDTINYGEITELVVGIIENESHQLLEKVATRIATEILTVPSVSGVRVNLRKMRPPVPQFLDSSAVNIYRTK
ncbi:MAG: dihydroneopterin aldolase [Acidimicrobiaceae bacterium]|jgi:dihydroneopterin aldolase|nr:dihydroneopterin aldolase [Acidimicrobiaceae bacterium]|tara:strand:- start:36592 stop:36951 length:360 start_codon:yes stop_codon:yes gene_type:complete